MVESEGHVAGSGGGCFVIVHWRVAPERVVCACKGRLWEQDLNRTKLNNWHWVQLVCHFFKTSIHPQDHQRLAGPFEMARFRCPTATSSLSSVDSTKSNSRRVDRNGVRSESAHHPS